MIPPTANIQLGEHARQTFLSKNPQFTEDDLRTRVSAARLNARKGYRDGVWLVSIDPTGFKRRVRMLVDGDYLFGKFRPRVKGEQPRKKVGVLHVGELPDAVAVDAVLYSRATLEEGGDKVEEGVDYEIVTFLAKDSQEDEPMDTETLLHNHFLSDGGTSTKMSDSEFVAALRKSHEYWKNRAHIH